MEMRTMLLKRLAFTLFCTDGDQYQRLLPEIQGETSCCAIRVESSELAMFSFSRKIIRESSSSSVMAERTSSGLPLLPCSSIEDIPATCHFSVALGDRRNGSSTFTTGT